LFWRLHCIQEPDAVRRNQSDWGVPAQCPKKITRPHLLLPLLFVLACPAQARIYMYVDADGRKGATDRRGEVPAGAKITSVIDSGGADEVAQHKSSGSRAKTPTPANFPRIDDATQKKRDNVRRSVLEEELASEQKNLEEARRQLASGEKPLAGEDAAAPAYLARVKQLRSTVERHQRNIAAIQKEISTVR
jgi:hypothetical protein